MVVGGLGSCEQPSVVCWVNIPILGSADVPAAPARWRCEVACLRGVLAPTHALRTTSVSHAFTSLPLHATHVSCGMSQEPGRSMALPTWTSDFGTTVYAAAAGQPSAAAAAGPVQHKI